MGSIRAFRCRHCRTEVLATRDPARHAEHTGWSAPLLCCGQPLRPVETGQAVTAPLPGRRPARCHRCGYVVDLVVQPEGPLLCRVCASRLEMADGHGRRDG